MTTAVQNAEPKANNIIDNQGLDEKLTRIDAVVEPLQNFHLTKQNFFSKKINEKLQFFLKQILINQHVSLNFMIFQNF